MHPNVSCSTIYNSQDMAAIHKCPSIDKWIKMWYIYTTEYYSAINMNKIMIFAATQKDLEIIRLSEVSQRKTNIIWYHLYVESKKEKKIQMNLFTKQTYRLVLSEKISNVFTTKKKW